MRVWLFSFSGVWLPSAALVVAATPEGATALAEQLLKDTPGVDSDQNFQLREVDLSSAHASIIYDGDY